MGICAACGNEYHATFEVRPTETSSFVFDSFGCAIQVLAPACPRCGIRVIGHGVEVHDVVFCSAHCARGLNRSSRIDRIGADAVG
jgi:hypothetical protein